MNHKKRARRQASFRGKWRQFRLRRLGRRNKRPKRLNHWFQHDDLTFSKIIMRDVERLWLQQNAPTAKIVVQKVPNHQHMAAFKRGEWDGNAYFVIFDKKDLSNAILFRMTWWCDRV